MIVIIIIRRRRNSSAQLTLLEYLTEYRITVINILGDGFISNMEHTLVESFALNPNFKSEVEICLVHW